MGHSEMLLAVAGLKPDEVNALRAKLADGDWSDFPEPQQAAFGIAYQLSRNPSAITDEYRKRLVAVFGPERTADLIWYVSWCNYMTRFADAFQLPLEKENAFAPPTKKEKK